MVIGRWGEFRPHTHPPAQSQAGLSCQSMFRLHYIALSNWLKKQTHQENEHTILEHTSA